MPVVKLFRSTEQVRLMIPTITPDKIALPPGTRLCFPGTLADYEHLLARLGDRGFCKRSVEH